MRTVFFIPSLPKLSGGMAVIFELADSLQRQGYPVALSGPDGASGNLGLSKDFLCKFEWLPWKDVSGGGVLCPSDIWCVPESWPNSMVAGVKGGARTIVYVQNWAFLMDCLPQGVSWKQLPVEYLAVSHPVAWCMREVFGLDNLGVLTPSIPALYYGQNRSVCRDEKVRVAWMPRKNRALGGQILQIATARLQGMDEAVELEVRAIENMDRAGVAAVLADTDIFLSTGFPEGCPLPPLEAMACGCVVVGFGGVGGFEYMRNPADINLPGLYRPLYELPALDWDCNGLYASDGDVLSAGLLLAEAARMASSVPAHPHWERMRQGAALTAERFNQNKWDQRVLRIWSGLMQPI